ncbi:arginase family protein [Spirillospora sp. CA-294931]|uniref:arginase family protein n=1 Tax=Spirillospora sp. CA-294931 TaxID=3240042 RepID=UPI003D8F3864
MTRLISVLDAPSNLGLRPPYEGHEPGVRLLPGALRAHDIVARLGADDAGVVVPPEYSFDLEPVTGYRNGLRIAAYTRDLADGVGRLLDDGRFPLVLGGDCSILLGPMLALRERGTYGLAYLDGHDDFSPYLDPAAHAGRHSPGGLALALVTGHGPAELSDQGGLRPYVAEEHAAHIGAQREPEDFEIADFAAFDASAIDSYPIEFIREHGAQAAADGARAHLERAPIEGFWIHIDADILDKSVMPAVDSPNPDGLDFAEFTAVLGTLLASPRAVGLHVGIFDPELDPDGSLAAALTDSVVAAFTA